MLLTKIKSLKKEQKEFIIFLLTTYGITCLMGILLAVACNEGKEGLASNPGLFSPAAGVILAKLIFERKSPFLPKRFFVADLVFSGILLLQRFLAFFFPAYIGSSDLTVAILLAEIFVLSILFCTENKLSLQAYGLSGMKWRLTIALSILFLFLIFCAHMIFKLAVGNIYIGESLEDGFSFQQGGGYVFIFIAFMTLSLFEEEYGWRYYLQPYLQKRFGMIIGVLMVGVMWEVWHLPSVLFNFASMNDVTLIQFLLLRMSNTIFLAIFIGYTYLKTHNLWGAILIHFLNNVFAPGYEWSSDKTEGWIMVIIWVSIRIGLSLPFLFTKTFRQPENVDV